MKKKLWSFFFLFKRNVIPSFFFCFQVWPMGSNNVCDDVEERRRRPYVDVDRSKLIARWRRPIVAYLSLYTDSLIVL